MLDCSFKQTARSLQFISFLYCKSKLNIVECNALAYAVEETNVTVNSTVIVSMYSSTKAQWRCVQGVPLGLLWNTQLLAQVSGWESQKENAQQQRGGSSSFSWDSRSFIWALRASMNLQSHNPSVYQTFRFTNLLFFPKDAYIILWSDFTKKKFWLWALIVDCNWPRHFVL